MIEVLYCKMKVVVMKSLENARSKNKSYEAREKKKGFEVVACLEWLSVRAMFTASSSLFCL